MKNIFFAIFFLITGTSQAQQLFQTVRGIVRDEVSRSPLAGVSVLLIQPEGAPHKGTMTDAGGEFQITGVPTGRHSFRLTLVGYEDQLLSNLIITGGKEVVLDVIMAESTQMLDEVMVVADRTGDKGNTNNELVLASGRSFNVDDTKRYAGSLGDPSRMAAGFAGVVSGNDARNDIVVRGNSPTGMLWQLEGLNIPNPNHFGSYFATGGPVSMLNNNVLAKSDFLTGAFPAQYGDALAAVFDLRMREGNNRKHEFIGQIGFNGFEIGAEGPFSKNSKASFLLNYRYSTLGVFKALGIRFGTGSSIPDYQDLNFKLSLPAGRKGKFSLFGITGSSEVQFLGNETDTTLTNLYGSENTNMRARYGTSIAGGAYEHTLSPRTHLKLLLGASMTKEKFSGDSISIVTREAFPSAESKFNTRKYSAVATFRHKFNARSSLYSGVTTDLLNFDLYSKTIHAGGTIDSLRVDEKGKFSVLTQAYTQLRYRLSGSLMATAGLHFQHLGLNGKSALEPRAGVRHSFGRGQAVGISYGLHSQSQNIYTYFIRTPAESGSVRTNRDLDFTRSHHFVLSYENRLSEHLLLKVEPYLQMISGVPVEQKASSFSLLNTGALFGPSDKDSLVNNGSGKNLGVELTLERYFNDGYYFLVTTSLFDSRYKGSDKVTRNTAFNTQYVANILGGKEIKIAHTNVLSFNLKSSLVGGRYFTPLDLAASRRKGQAVYREPEAFSERQKPYFRTDLRISYRWEMGKSTMEFALDLQNVTAHKNVFQQTYNPRTNALVYQYGQGFFPVPYFRATF
ncbi:carboxypeptidase-like regulatory domain-containing protein [Ravibacter arvi]|uniref:Carboxypeptidase-like regulatory domain-containing protein n=1 Tax=Ravibacter arvi TaxID=2051041 RepID=A0ABP8LQ75_9BACT